MELCEHLGMKRLTERQVTKLMNEIDVDGDGDISIEEFDIWWQENGGEKFRSARPPGPGDMSKIAKFQEKKRHRVLLQNKRLRRDGALSPRSGGSGSPRRSDFDIESSTAATPRTNEAGAPPAGGVLRGAQRGAAKAGS